MWEAIAADGDAQRALLAGNDARARCAARPSATARPGRRPRRARSDGWSATPRRRCWRATTRRPTCASSSATKSTRRRPRGRSRSPRCRRATTRRRRGRPRSCAPARTRSAAPPTPWPRWPRATATRTAPPCTRSSTTSSAARSTSPACRSPTPRSCSSGSPSAGCSPSTRARRCCPRSSDVRAILTSTRVWAVVGCSPDEWRDSHRIAALLQRRGHRVIPVNPLADEILGERAYPSLEAIGEPVEVVDIFRRSSKAGAHVDEAIAVGAGRRLDAARGDRRGRGVARPPGRPARRDGPLPGDRARAPGVVGAVRGGSMKGLMSPHPLTPRPRVLARRAAVRRQDDHDAHRDRPRARSRTATGRRARGGWPARSTRSGLSGDARVGTFAWNSARHLELYFAAPCSGRVLHTLNIRLFPEQVSYIVDHAEDEVIFVDRSLVSSCGRSSTGSRPSSGSWSWTTARATSRPTTGSSTTRSCWPAPTRPSSRSTTRTGPRPCATRAARRATRRASSTRIARPSSTASARCSPTRSASASGTRSCRSCRCSTPTRGASRTRR